MLYQQQTPIPGKYTIIGEVPTLMKYTLNTAVLRHQVYLFYKYKQTESVKKAIASRKLSRWP